MVVIYISEPLKLKKEPSSKKQSHVLNLKYDEAKQKVHMHYRESQ